MEMSSHQKFINELRSPVKRYTQMMKNRQSRKSNALQSDASAPEEEAELIRGLEAKFEELFGPLNNDD